MLRSAGALRANRTPAQSHGRSARATNGRAESRDSSISGFARKYDSSFIPNHAKGRAAAEKARYITASSARRKVNLQPSADSALVRGVLSAECLLEHRFFRPDELPVDQIHERRYHEKRRGRAREYPEAEQAAHHAEVDRIAGHSIESVNDQRRRSL